MENDDEFVRLTFNLNSEDDEDKIKIKQNRPLLTVLDNFHTEVKEVSFGVFYIFLYCRIVNIFKIVNLSYCSMLQYVKPFYVMVPIS